MFVKNERRLLLKRKKKGIGLSIIILKVKIKRLRERVVKLEKGERGERKGGEENKDKAYHQHRAFNHNHKKQKKKKKKKKDCSPPKRKYKPARTAVRLPNKEARPAIETAPTHT